MFNLLIKAILTRSMVRSGFRNCILSVLLCLCWLFYSPRSLAQSSPGTEANKIINAFTSYADSLPVEKIYLHTDKPDYAAGDTLWFKAYVLDGAFFRAAHKSGLLYLELANDSNYVVKRVMVPLVSGISWGQLVLLEKDTPPGGYMLRAYTNWMRNFDQEYIFTKRFSVVNTLQQDWLLNTHVNLFKDAGTPKARLNLQFKGLGSNIVGFKDLQLTVKEGKKNLFKDKVQTNAGGEVMAAFPLPIGVNHKQMYLQVEEKESAGNSRKTIVPIILNNPQEIDVQFMPESGYLVAGIPCRVALKAVDTNGNGTPVSGTIYNSRAQEVTPFSAQYKGMGVFSFIPQANESYTAKVSLPNNPVKNYFLPAIQNSGTVLKINNKQNSDSIEVIITSSPNVRGPANAFFLIGQARGVVCYGAAMILKNDVTRLMVAKNKFPTGITRFTLFNTAKQPVNERLTFVNRHDQLSISINPHKLAYARRDSIQLQIIVTNKAGKPVQGNFSLAVTDDAQVRHDSLGNNILSYLLLTSDLKGNIEDPNYYFQPAAGTEQQVWQDLDNLLLTQGWVGYNWQEVLKEKPTVVFQAEPDFGIYGRVTNALNKPLPRSLIRLLSFEPLGLTDTLTNEAGHFAFKYVQVPETPAFILEARNRRGRNSNVNIEVKEFVPPLVSRPVKRHIPWYLNPDTSVTRQVQNFAKQQQEQWKHLGGLNMLKTVNVFGKKMVKETKNLNGAGNADFVLDERDLEAARKMTLEQVLKTKFAGFQKVITPNRIDYSFLNGKKIFLVIDGLNISRYGLPTKTYMETLTAEDIVGIEIMNSVKYGLKYDPEIIFKNAGCRGCPPPPVYIEITTRSGNGAFMRKTPGLYVYKPLPMNYPKKFYSPKYPAGGKAPVLPDMRSTIFWAPEIITDKTGKATISFYSSDMSGTYTTTIEGTDMTGHLGRSTSKIKVNK